MYNLEELAKCTADGEKADLLAPSAWLKLDNDIYMLRNEMVGEKKLKGRLAAEVVGILVQKKGFKIIHEYFREVAEAIKAIPVLEGDQDVFLEAQETVQRLRLQSTSKKLKKRRTSSRIRSVTPTYNQSNVLVQVDASMSTWLQDILSTAMDTKVRAVAAAADAV